MRKAGIHGGGIAGLLLLLILGTVSGVRAQTSTSSIQGVILDQSGPIADATVEVTGTESGFKRTAKTGPDGRFSLPGLTPGVYTLTVSSAAYAPARTRTPRRTSSRTASDCATTSPPPSAARLILP
ncbi:MAG TPA: carboxypeptidase-like regulatory domain-containing protein [Thermoanaerobaculia bacterium]